MYTIPTFRREGRLNRKNLFPPILGIVFALLASSTVLAQQNAPEATESPIIPLAVPDLKHPETLEALIRYGYQRLSLLAQPGGHDLTFDLSDFQTTYRDDFDEILYKNQYTQSGGDVIMANRALSEQAPEHVFFDMFWHHVPSFVEGLDSERRVLYETITYDDYLRGTFDKEEYERIHALTTYRVVASLNGKVRDYKASVSWYDDEDGKLAIAFLDEITMGIEDALIEQRKPGDLKRRELIPEEDVNVDGIHGLAAKSTATCIAETWTETVPADFISDATGHASGTHWMAMDSSTFQCRCESSCQLKSDMTNLPNVTKKDDGALPLDFRYCHKLSTPSKLQSCSEAVRGDTTQTGTIGCSVGFRTLWKQCEKSLAGNCDCNVAGLTLTVSGLGLSASFSLTGNPDGGVEFGDKSSGSCQDKCYTVGGSSEEPLNDPGEGTNGGNGGNQDPTPIILDLDRGNFELTGLDNPVFFDMDGDGVLDEVAWTAPWSEDGFLALDRDKNGLIDNGRELFGNFTVGQAGEGPLNGYRALAVFDIPWIGIGGNADGVISREDDVFSSLVIWIDRSHDGYSQASELYSLDDMGIESIELDYHESRRRDRWGNAFRFASHATLKGHGKRKVQTVDVFLRTRWGRE